MALEPAHNLFEALLASLIAFGDLAAKAAMDHSDGFGHQGVELEVSLTLSVPVSPCQLRVSRSTRLSTPLLASIVLLNDPFFKDLIKDLIQDLIQDLLKARGSSS